MKNYGKVYSMSRPPEIEITGSTVLIASNIQSCTKIIENQSINGYEYDYIEYTKDEYLMQQNAKVNSLEQELQAAKILLGVD